MATSKFASASTTKSRTTRVKPIPAAVDAQFVDTETANDDNVVLRYLKAQQDMLDQAGVPTGKRFLCAFVASIVVAIGITYVSMALIDMAVLAAITLTGSAFVALVIWLLGAIATIVVSALASGRAFGYVASRAIDEHFASAKSFARNLFARRGLEAA